jgi:hypothetical protein
MLRLLLYLPHSQLLLNKKPLGVFLDLVGGPELRGMETRRVDALPVGGRTPKINPRLRIQGWIRLQ